MASTEPADDTIDKQPDHMELLKARIDLIEKSIKEQRIKEDKLLAENPSLIRLTNISSPNGIIVKESLFLQVKINDIDYTTILS